MADRLKSKVAIVVGGGQTPGETIGNGKATALLFAREGAKVLVVDMDLARAEETCHTIASEGGTAVPFEADVGKSEDCAAIPEKCMETFGQVNILHNNVGIGGWDSGLLSLKEEVWDNIMDINLKSMFLTCKSTMPHLVASGGGAIINISSVAAVAGIHNILAYKISKSGVNSLTQAVAMGAAKKGVRVNAIMPGLMNTPMAVDGISEGKGIDRAELVAQRNAMVPLKGGMGSAWDIAYAALFLASDEAKFITGVILPVDGGQTAKVG